MDYYIISSLLLTIMTGIAIFYKLQFKSIIILILFTITLLFWLFATHIMLGNPLKSNWITHMIYKNVETGKLLFFRVNGKESILLLIQINNVKTPMYLNIKWSNKLEEQLVEINKMRNKRRSNQDGEGDGEGDLSDMDIEVSRPFYDGLETRPQDIKPSKAPQFNRRINKPNNDVYKELKIERN